MKKFSEIKNFEDIKFDVQIDGSVVYLKIKNDSGTDITFGKEFVLEYYNNSQWETVKTKPGSCFAEVLMLVKNGSEYTERIDLSWYFEELAAGKYRITKVVRAGNEGSIQSEFTQSTPTPSQSTPEPTPVQTPNHSDSDSELCGPCVMEYAAYMDCRISDIGESYVEISDADGEVICRFVEHSPSPGLLTPEKYYLDSNLEVVYAGILTDINSGMPFNSYNNFFGYAAKGDPINYSDIRIGDIVDVVYCYGLDHPEVEKRVYFCAAINVHKR